MFLNGKNRFFLRSGVEEGGGKSRYTCFLNLHDVEEIFEYVTVHLILYQFIWKEQFLRFLPSSILSLKLKHDWIWILRYPTLVNLICHQYKPTYQRL